MVAPSQGNRFPCRIGPKPYHYVKLKDRYNFEQDTQHRWCARKRQQDRWQVLDKAVADHVLDLIKGKGSYICVDCCQRFAPVRQLRGHASIASLAQPGQAAGLQQQPQVPVPSPSHPQAAASPSHLADKSNSSQQPQGQQQGQRQQGMPAQQCPKPTPKPPAEPQVRPAVAVWRSERASCIPSGRWVQQERTRCAAARGNCYLWSADVLQPSALLLLLPCLVVMCSSCAQIVAISAGHTTSHVCLGADGLASACLCR